MQHSGSLLTGGCSAVAELDYKLFFWVVFFQLRKLELPGWTRRLACGKKREKGEKGAASVISSSELLNELSSEASPVESNLLTGRGSCANKTHPHNWCQELRRKREESSFSLKNDAKAFCRFSHSLSFNYNWKQTSGNVETAMLINLRCSSSKI